jgi:hypothetical protein
LYAKFLDLQILANFAGHLPLPADQRQMLADFAPKGQLKEFSASGKGLIRMSQPTKSRANLSICPCSRSQLS